MPEVINSWRGDAQAKSQIESYQITDAEVGDTFTITVNNKDVSYTLTQDDVDDAPSLTASQVAMTNLIAALVAAAEDIAEFNEMTYASSDGDDGIEAILVTGPEDGKPFTIVTSTGDAGNLAVVVTEVVKGSAGKNEIQQVLIAGTPTGGTFTLTFDGQTTGTIAYNASASTVKSALEALSNIDSVTVTGSGPWSVEFKGTWLNTDVPLMTGNGASITKASSGYSVSIATIQTAVAGQNEIQRLTIPSITSGGTFTLSLGGQTTSALAYNISAANMKTALELLSTINSVTVTKPSTGVWTVEFGGTQAQTDVSTLVGNGESLTGAAAIAIATTQEGSSSTNTVFSHSKGVTVTIEFVHALSNSSAVNWHLSAFGFTGSGYNSFTINSSHTLAQVQDVVDAYLASAYKGSVYPYTPMAGDIIVTEDATKFYFECAGPFSGVLRGIQGPSATVPLLQMRTSFGTHLSYTDAVGDPVDEIQTVTIQNGPTGGTFTLTFEGQTTSALPYNETAANVETALEALSNLTAPDVAVTKSGSVYTVTFSLSRDVAQMTASAASLTGCTFVPVTTQTALVAINEKQTVTINGNPKGGTFTLTWNAETTSGLDFDATAAEVQAELEGLTTPGPGDFTVTGIDGGVWTVEFKGSYEGTNVAAMTGDGTSLSGADIFVNTTQSATPTIDEQQSVAITGSPTGGTFTLTYDSQTTGAIAYNATASLVKVSLEALSSIDIGEINVSGSDGGPWEIIFQNGLGAQDVTAISGSGASLTSEGTQAIAKTVVQVPMGPNWVTEDENWTLGHSPADGETMLLENSTVSLLYGLDFSAVNIAKYIQKSTFTGEVGLKQHTGLYYEYRPTELSLGFDAGGDALVVEIGEGSGSGSGLTRLNTNDRETIMDVYTSSTSTDGAIPAINWRGTHADNVIRIQRGKLGIAALYGQVATVSQLWMSFQSSVSSDAEVTVGADAEIDEVYKTGGALICAASLGALNNHGGDTLLKGTKEVSVIDATAGVIFAQTTGILGQYGSISGITQASPAVVTSYSSQLAIVLQEDSSGESFVTETTDANDAGTGDWDIFPAGVGADDACYFGLAQRFGKLAIDLGTAGAGTYTVTWEYWDGDEWVALAGISDGTTAFKAGTSSYDVTWTAPGLDWKKTSVNSSADLYFVRARRNGGTVSTDPVGDSARAFVPHGLSNGHSIRIAEVAGMLEVNQREFTIQVVDAYSFQLIGLDASAYTAYSSAGTWGRVGSVQLALAAQLDFSTQIEDRSVSAPIVAYGDSVEIIDAQDRITTLTQEDGEFAVQWYNTTRFGVLGGTNKRHVRG